MSKKPCPTCDGLKDRQAKRCASCSGYGRKRHLGPTGYVRVYCPGHPTANADGYAAEHRKVLHDAGVDLPPGTHVHHINGDKQDNRLANLEVLSASDHLKHHVHAAGQVVNQFGTWPVMTPEERRRRKKELIAAWRAKNQEHIREYKRRTRAVR